MLTLSSQTLAQSQQAKPNGRTAARTVADPNEEARRQVAISLLTQLADEARSYQDITLRARVQARAADSLWTSDEGRARALFRRAWDAAETVDRESLRQLEEDRQRQMRASGRAAIFRSPRNLRGEVLRMAAKRDRALAEEFLGKLTDADHQEAADASTTSENSQAQQQQKTPDPATPPADVAQRLGLARQLLDEGNVDLAIQFADRALDRVTVSGINFLSALREKNLAAADQRFTALLARAGADPLSDASTVSVLSSYVFTPFLVIILHGNGGTQTMQDREHITPPAGMPPLVRAAFFKTAARILLRPLPQPDQDRTLAGRRGLYFTIARLVPLFDQYAPNYAPELHAQMAALAPDAPEDLRNGSSRMLTRGLASEEQSRDESQEVAERAERAATTEERNGLYARAALIAAQRGDAHAHDFVEKIDNADIRNQLRPYVDFLLVSNAIHQKAVDEALRLAHAGDLTNVQRAYALMEVMRLLKQSEPARAAQILEEAAMEARRIGGTDPDRARALTGVATRMFEINRPRAWEAISEAIKAANSNSEFTGEDAEIAARFSLPNYGTSYTSSSADLFDVRDIFASLAKEDLYRAIELAKSYTSDAPRAAAILAVARAILNVNTPRFTQRTQEVQQTN
ncbi:MAG: hypothetical protein AUG51_16385 [Acidobacteria bacterium 13_1_20CM_3_53_8]|nr:MAG: hypothetical protein AUG51_16385 [Acidobacteria bacterium 13_1_20CM_3_53_8]